MDSKFQFLVEALGLLDHEVNGRDADALSPDFKAQLDLLSMGELPKDLMEKITEKLKGNSQGLAYLAERIRKNHST